MLEGDIYRCRIMRDTGVKWWRGKLQVWNDGGVQVLNYGGAQVWNGVEAQVCTGGEGHYRCGMVKGGQYKR